MKKFDRTFPTEPEFIPYLLSQVALDVNLAKELWDILGSLEFRYDFIKSEEELKMELGFRTKEAFQKESEKKIVPKYIVVIVHSGKSLAPKDSSGRANPYVVVHYGDIQQQRKQQTPIDSQTLAPNWDKAGNVQNALSKIHTKKKEITFDTVTPDAKVTVEGHSNAFKFVYDENDSNHNYIKFICMNKDSLWKSDEYMGSFEIQPGETLKYKTYLLEDNFYKDIQSKTTDAPPVDTLKTQPKSNPKINQAKKRVVKEHKHVSGTLTISVRFYDEKGIEVIYTSD